MYSIKNVYMMYIVFGSKCVWCSVSSVMLQYSNSPNFPKSIDCSEIWTGSFIFITTRHIDWFLALKFQPNLAIFWHLIDCDIDNVSIPQKWDQSPLVAGCSKWAGTWFRSITSQSLLHRLQLCPKSFTHYSLYHAVNYVGNNQAWFRTLHWKLSEHHYSNRSTRS